ncbi:cyclase family protein [Sphaerochaeta sp. PS]|uniref:cyclase family protein n=1 Tax=Sphaerochaeta sp. PS TaxID=3076336 RepID=UPI0028A3014E|nr:cyclase family protein [Sphaerochaeta sp. PS]MDT4761677.1 cyclase family protein [Sphaerochaeta sp. PS]
MFKRYSYDLTSTGPVWPGNPPAALVEAHESMEKGDNANTFKVQLFTHSGTHIDVPMHFNRYGKNAIDLGVEQFIFHKPLVLDIPKQDEERILPEDLIPHKKAIGSCDLLCINTGWSALRQDQPGRYAKQGPYVSNDAVQYLLAEFPSVRAIGLDFISLGSPLHIPETIQAHTTATGNNRAEGRFILIIEDMILDEQLNKAKRVFAWPLFIEGSDAGPVTIVAEF